MYPDLYQYLQWMQNHIQSQERRITSLEKTIKLMRDELDQLKEKQPINIERMEYSFDQLKIERLEGTLNIGLNPNDLAGIEDFAVENQQLSAPLSPQALMKRSQKIEEEIYRYLESDLAKIIEEEKEKLNIRTGESYLSFIKEDILKQLPNRIDAHLKANKSGNEAIDPKSLDKQIIELLKQEIQNGVHVFLSNLPENVKGMKKE